MCEFSQLDIVPIDSDGNERDVAVRYCRRYPPHTIVVEGEALRHDQQVDDDDWCGEYLSAVVDAEIVEPEVGARVVASGGYRTCVEPGCTRYTGVADGHCWEHPAR